MIKVELVLSVHSLIIERFGGTSGLRDLNALESALARPFMTFEGKELYSSPILKAAALIESLISNHPFLDGNKRTGFICAMTFIRLNGYSIDQIDPDQNEDNYVNLALSVINRSKGIPEVIKWFGSRIYS